VLSRPFYFLGRFAGHSPPVGPRFIPPHHDAASFRNIQPNQPDAASLPSVHFGLADPLWLQRSSRPLLVRHAPPLVGPEPDVQSRSQRRIFEAWAAVSWPSTVVMARLNLSRMCLFPWRPDAQFSLLVVLIGRLTVVWLRALAPALHMVTMSVQSLCSSLLSVGLRFSPCFRLPPLLS